MGRSGPKGYKNSCFKLKGSGMTQVVPISTNQSYVFDRRYQLLNSIGRGHNSIIYKAKRYSENSSTNSQTLFALKIVTGSPRNPERNIDRVQREALGLLASRHPNVLRLIDYVVEGEYCYLVVEYADSGDLKAALERRSSPFLPETVLHIALKVLGGLEAIHNAGIIHRDLKPENLLLFSDGTVKIADFGVCLLPSDDQEIARASSSVGTLDYLAPECLEGAGCSQASDVYCLGVTLYQLLTKRMPFEGQSFAQIVENKVKGNSIPLERFLNNPPPLLNDLFKQAFHSDPDYRFQTVDEFRNAINSYLDGTWVPHGSSTPAPSYVRVREESTEDFADTQAEEESYELGETEQYSDDSEELDFDAELETAGEKDTHIQTDNEISAHKGRFAQLAPLFQKKSLVTASAVILAVIIAVGVKDVFDAEPTVNQLAVKEKSVEDSRAMLSKPEQATSYSGMIYGLLSDSEATPLYVETLKNNSNSLLILGLPGWTPQVIDLKNLQPGQTTSIAANGMQLTFAVENSAAENLEVNLEVENDDRLAATNTRTIFRGTFLEETTGRRGDWVLSPRSY